MSCSSILLASLFLSTVGVVCLVIALICATCGGVTVGGRHYGIGCSLDNGVIVDTGTPK